MGEFCRCEFELITDCNTVRHPLVRNAGAGGDRQNYRQWGRPHILPVYPNNSSNYWQKHAGKMATDLDWRCPASLDLCEGN